MLGILIKCSRLFDRCEYTSVTPVLIVIENQVNAGGARPSKKKDNIVN